MKASLTSKSPHCFYLFNYFNCYFVLFSSHTEILNAVLFVFLYKEGWNLRSPFLRNWNVRTILKDNEEFWNYFCRYFLRMSQIVICLSYFLLLLFFFYKKSVANILNVHILCQLNGKTGKCV